jgi:hypothetical protein
MFEDIYPCITQRINSIDNDTLKIKLKDNINSIKLNIANVLFINDYEITCKIEQHYLNTNVPISRNSNSVTIKNPYSSYIYYLCIYILNSSNYNECYSHGEFVITFDYLYTLITDLELMINKIIKNNNYVDPLDEIKIIFTELIDNTFEPNKYMYLLHKETTPEDSEDENQNVESSSTESDDRLEKITDNFTEDFNNKIYLFDDNLIESDEESIESVKTDTLINDIRTNLVNILGQ